MASSLHHPAAWLERGFDGSGADAIMRRVELSHGDFYRHVQSKDDLATEAVAHGLAAYMLAHLDRLD